MTKQTQTAKLCDLVSDMSLGLKKVELPPHPPIESPSAKIMYGFALLTDSIIGPILEQWTNVINEADVGDKAYILVFHVAS